MGLSDIDEDEPPLPCNATTQPTTTTTTAAATATTVQGSAGVDDVGKVNLDDLFGLVGGTQGSATRNNNNYTSNNNTPAIVASPVAAWSAGAVASSSSTSPSSTNAHDVLDSLFAVPATAAAASAGQQALSSSGAAAGATATEGAAAPILYVDDTTQLACDMNNAARRADGGNNNNGGNSKTGGMGGGGAHAAATAATSVNLFDLSKPVQWQRHESAESVLAAFEQQGKRRGYDDANSLAKLTRNKDDNKVKARLLALMNYYDVLDVAPTATTEEIRQSYKRKALTLHPDKAGQRQTAEEAELFKIITKAHEVLTDDAQRAAYDAQVRNEANNAAGDGNWLQHLRPS